MQKKSFPQNSSIGVSPKRTDLSLIHSIPHPEVLKPSTKSDTWKYIVGVSAGLFMLTHYLAPHAKNTTRKQVTEQIVVSPTLNSEIKLILDSKTEQNRFLTEDFRIGLSHGIPQDLENFSDQVRNDIRDGKRGFYEIDFPALNGVAGEYTINFESKFYTSAQVNSESNKLYLPLQIGQASQLTLTIKQADAQGLQIHSKTPAGKEFITRPLHVGESETMLLEAQ